MYNLTSMMSVRVDTLITNVTHLPGMPSPPAPLPVGEGSQRLVFRRSHRYKWRLENSPYSLPRRHGRVRESTLDPSPACGVREGEDNTE